MTDTRVSPPPVMPSARPSDHRVPGSRPRWRIGVGAVAVGLGVLLVVAVLVSALSASSASGSAPVGEPSALIDRKTANGGGGASGASGEWASGSGDGGGADGATSSEAFVHVLGRVAHPGLFRVAADARVVDAVSAAGGFTADADQAQVNLARPVVDGEQLVVPAVGEVVAGVTAGGAVSSMAGGSAGGAAAGAGATPVDLNRADSAALETLPGVGPATAAAIIGWRDDNGRFASVDDLLAVSGIGEKKLEKFRDLVVVR